MASRVRNGCALLIAHFLTQINVQGGDVRELCGMTHPHDTSSSLRRDSRWAGVFFLIPLLAYGVGNAWLEALRAVPSPGSPWAWTGASLLLAINSIVVVLLARRLQPIVRQVRARVAHAYLLARVLEAVLLLLGSAVWLAHTDQLTDQVHFYTYQLAMLALGVGSLPLFCLLGRTGMLPNGLAWWAIGGYSLLALGAVGELCGLPYGIALSIPGGLLEVTLGIWLIVKGLRPATHGYTGTPL